MKKYLGSEGIGKLVGLIKAALAEKADKAYVDDAIQAAIGDAMTASY